MTLNEVPEILYGDSLEFKGTIRSFPKHTRVIWMKGDEEIDITRPKYKGSSDIGDCPLLCIHNVNSEDQDEYTVQVYNELGMGKCKSEKLVVIGGKLKTFKVNLHPI